MSDLRASVRCGCERNDAHGYAISGGYIYLAPEPTDTTLTLHYYQKLDPAFVGQRDQLADLSTNPDVYLWGALTMAELYIWDDPRVPMWKSAWDEAMASPAARQRKRHGGGPLTPRTGKP
jgi:hypothetical protein